MLEYYEIENIEQLRAVADLLRLRILDLLKEQPMTVKQLGDAMGEAPAKVHYHVRELERVGLLRLVETREKGGILEKYYQPVAREIAVEKQLLSAPPDESMAMLSAMFNQMKDGFLRAMREAIARQQEHPNLVMGLSHLYMTPEETKQVCKQIFELLKPYETRRGIAREQEMENFMVLYPHVSTTLTPSQMVLEEEMGQGMGAAQRTWAVGAVEFSRADLEKALAEGRRLRIDMIGVCHFADDIPAALVEQAVEHFHLNGKLYASPAVREILQERSHSLTMNIDK